MENNNRRKLGTYQICLIALAIVMNVIGGQIALALRLPRGIQLKELFSHLLNFRPFRQIAPPITGKAQRTLFLRSNIGSPSNSPSRDSKHNRPTHSLFCSPINPPRLVIHENNSLHNFKPGGTCHITQDVDKLTHTSFFPLDVALCPDSCRVRRAAGVVILPGIRHCSLLCQNHK